MTQYTTEDLKKIYDRAVQIFSAKRGFMPDSVMIDDDGSIKVEHVQYYCGDSDYTQEYIRAEDLTNDLDEIILQRKEQEEKEKQAQYKHQVEQDALRKVTEKNNRKAQYLKLKEEFE